MVRILALRMKAFYSTAGAAGNKPAGVQLPMCYYRPGGFRGNTKKHRTMKTPLKKEDFTQEELDKCTASPVYFYNKYVRKEGMKELTEEEFKEQVTLYENIRNTPIRRRNMDRPLLPAECFEKLPSFLKVGGQK